jgi:glycosyltransferase involved in cell wall biosynthesis
MHVLLITSSYPMELIGGAELQTLILANGLAEYGHDVTFLAADTNVESKSRINNLDVIKIPGMDKVGIARHKQCLEKAILESHPDICYIRSFSELMWAIPFCKNNEIPVVSISCSNGDVPPFLTGLSFYEQIKSMCTVEIIQYFLNFRAIRLSDVHLCVTKSLQEDTKRWYPDKPMRVIYNGHPVPPDEDVHKNCSRRVIWVNNVKRFKRPEMFIKLASCLPDIEFAMIGRIDKGRYGNHILSLIQHGPSNLKYLGALPFDKVNTEISMSDILFYTSTVVEGFGNSLIQAWMRGVPTISLNYDPDGIIERERIGYCSSNFSVLANNARELIDNQAMLRDMGQRARSYAKINHDCKYMVSQYDIFFRELYNQKSK